MTEKAASTIQIVDVSLDCQAHDREERSETMITGIYGSAQLLD
jgi:hypothetical protein